jgi:hypothetical protein
MIIEDVAHKIHADGHGIYDPDGDTGTIYLGMLPRTPKDVVSIFLREGGESDPFNEYVKANVQIIVRSVNKIGGMSRAQNILRSFNGQSEDFKSGGNTVINCMAKQAEPIDIGQDEAKNYEWSINLEIDYYIGR